MCLLTHICRVSVCPLGKPVELTAGVSCLHGLLLRLNPWIGAIDGTRTGSRGHPRSRPNGVEAVLRAVKGGGLLDQAWTKAVARLVKVLLATVEARGPHSVPRHCHVYVNLHLSI